MTNKKPLTIIKIGGKIVEDKIRLNDFLQDYANFPGAKILVHGGGKTASNMIKDLGLQPKMIDGRRVTDTKTLEIVTMVYAGLINKNIVAQLQAFGTNALGLSGADLNSIQAHKRVVDKIDYGYAGDVDKVNGKIISSLLLQNISPVFCAITHDQKGQLLNTNADTITAELAKALTESFAVKVVYCFEKDGVLKNPEDDNSLISNITKKEYLGYKKDGTIINGMIPKMDNAFDALEHSVEAVYIASSAILKSNKLIGGTKLCLQ